MDDEGGDEEVTVVEMVVVGIVDKVESIELNVPYRLPPQYREMEVVTVEVKVRVKVGVKVGVMVEVKVGVMVEVTSVTFVSTPGDVRYFRFYPG